jgi:hypothetical protein
LFLQFIPGKRFDVGFGFWKFLVSMFGREKHDTILPAAQHHQMIQHCNNLSDQLHEKLWIQSNLL